EMSSEPVAVAEASIHFNPSLKFLATKRTRMSTRLQLQGAACGPRIPKFPGFIGKILCCDNILADVPAAVIASQNKLKLHLAFFLFTSLGIGIDKIESAIVPYHLAQGLVGSDIFKLNVKHGIDHMLA